jgi:hypothetical protein
LHGDVRRCAGRIKDVIEEFFEWIHGVLIW